MGYYDEKIGSRYKEYNGIKNLAEKTREYVKKYSDFKFSITKEEFSMGCKLNVLLVSGKSNLVKDGHAINEIVGRINRYNIEENEILLDDVKNMLADVRDYVMSYNYTDSCMMTDYYNTNFYFDIQISYEYENENDKRITIDENSFVKTYAELYRQMDGKKVKCYHYYRQKEYIGTFNNKSTTYILVDENGKQIMFGEKENKITRITKNGFEKYGIGKQVAVRYELV